MIMITMVMQYCSIDRREKESILHFNNMHKKKKKAGQRLMGPSSLVLPLDSLHAPLYLSQSTPPLTVLLLMLGSKLKLIEKYADQIIIMQFACQPEVESWLGHDF